MRQYLHLRDCLNETIRELFSRGQLQFDPTVQGKKVIRDEYETKELLNYNYMYTPLPQTTIPTEIELMLKDARTIFKRDQHQYKIAFSWFQSFFNKTKADTWWKSSKFLSKYWKKFNAINPSDNTFSYTYGERISSNISKAILKLHENPSSRAVYIPVWSPTDLTNSLANKRVPCTLGYQLYIRQRELNMIIYQRSCDLVNFFPLDISKAILLQLYVLRELNKNSNQKLPLTFGSTYHYILSLHAYKVDVPDDRKW